MKRLETYKLPRLHTKYDLSQGLSVPLDDDQAYYFKTVLRKQPQDEIRVFNGRDGEYLASLRFEGKKTGFIDILAQIKPQTLAPPERHLYFVLPKKKAFDLLIEKSVELGATHFHPLISQNAQVRTIEELRVRQQIIEACEQSERLHVPTLFPVSTLQEALKTAPNLLAAVELQDAPTLGQVMEAIEPNKALSFLTGPEGGFTAQERSLMNICDHIQIVSLGEAILKVETAIFFCLSAVKLQAQKAGII